MREVPVQRRNPPPARSQMGQGREARARFRVKLLARLPGPGEPAASTRELGNAFGLDEYERSALWTILDKLAKDGLVTRVAREGERVRYWRRTAVGDQEVRRAAGQRLGPRS
jgi:hypothetical protein